MSYLSTAGDDAPDSIAELDRCVELDNAVFMAIADLQLALIRQTGIGTLIAAGGTRQDLDARIVEVDRAVTEAFERYNRALCTQARGEPYRLLEASHGGVARSMRFRLAQNRTVASIEAHALRQPRLTAEA